MAKKKLIKANREKLAEFAALMALGLDENQIQLKMGLHYATFEVLIERYYKELEIRHAAHTTIRTYLDYASRQNQLVRDLEGLKDSLRESLGMTESKKKKDEANTKRIFGAGANAYVGAVKAQSDIFDKVISTGQNLGVIKVAPKRIEHVNGKAVQDMDQKELNDEMVKTLKDMQQMLNPRQSRYGRKPVCLVNDPDPSPASEDAKQNTEEN